MVSGRLPEYVHVAHKPTNAYRVLAAVVAVIPFLGLCYLSGLVWSRQIITNVSDVVAAQRTTLGKPASSGAITLAAAGSFGTSSSSSSCLPVIKFMPPPKTRQDIALFLQHEGFETGAQLGVQHGVSAAESLFVWRSCKRYYLVDPYDPQQQKPLRVSTPAGTSGNQAHKQGDQQQQEQVETQAEVLQQARENLQTWQHKLVWLNTTTSNAADLVKEPLDYIYLAAHKDYCSVLQALHDWWPLLKPGGIMAGHSYENAVDVLRQSGQDWSRCPDGTTVHQGAVQAAVNEFFEQQNLQIVVTYRETAWNTWVVRKPYHPCSSHDQAGAEVAMEREGHLTELLSKMLQQEPQQQQQQEQQQGREQQQQDDEVGGDALHHLSATDEHSLLVPAAAASQQQHEQQQQQQAEDEDSADDTFQPHQPRDTGIQDSQLAPTTQQQQQQQRGDNEQGDAGILPVAQQQPAEHKEQARQEQPPLQRLQADAVDVQKQLHEGAGDTREATKTGHQQHQQQVSSSSSLQRQEHQQLGAALQKLHDGDGLAATRAQHDAQYSAADSDRINPGADDVFGDILTTHTDQDQV
jgi:hypothetical protein